MIPPGEFVARMERSGMRVFLAKPPMLLDCGAARLHPGYEARKLIHV
jgi:hypothetical protein